MRGIKKAGLLAVVAAAVAVGLGAGSASASVLCSTNTSPCTGTVYGAKTVFTAKNVTGSALTWTTNFGNFSCAGSTLSGELTNAEGAGLITSETSQLCTEPGGGACSLVVENLPWAFQATAAGKGNGTFTLSGNSGTKPQIHISCGTFNCSFPLSAMTLTGGNPAKLSAVKQPVKLEGVFCPSEATFDTEYEITAPKPLFVV